ncbi:hypothetical protein BD560DRAFT_421835 [Blakeslea trispora]|nr:hypothetical protein BD560DRAFT_421835 [Blakeslea trispora]
MIIFSLFFFLSLYQSHLNYILKLCHPDNLKGNLKICNLRKSIIAPRAKKNVIYKKEENTRAFPSTKLQNYKSTNAFKLSTSPFYSFSLPLSALCSSLGASASISSLMGVAYDRNLVHFRERPSFSSIGTEVGMTEGNYAA